MRLIGMFAIAGRTVTTGRTARLRRRPTDDTADRIVALLTRGRITDYVWIDSLPAMRAHFANAQAKGARIVEGIRQHGYRGYVADDPEGRRWTFAQARPTMWPCRPHPISQPSVRGSPRLRRVGPIP